MSCYAGGMANGFAHIVAGFEKAGAFKPVVGTTDVYPGYRNDSENIRDPRQLQSSFSSVFNGLKIYLPMPDFQPAAATWGLEAASRSFDVDFILLMAEHRDDLNRNLGEYAARRIPVGQRPLKSTPGFSATSKITPEEHDVLAKVLNHHPQLLAANTMMQASHIVFLRSLLEELVQYNPYDAEKTYIITKAIDSMGQMFLVGNFGMPMTYIAIAYHERITEKGKIPPDYSKPMLEEDFIDGWQRIVEGGGFKVDYSKVPGATPEQLSLLPRGCPFGTRAAPEICADGSGALPPHAAIQRQMAMGAQTWEFYERLSTPQSLALHRAVYADLADPVKCKALYEQGINRTNKSMDRTYYVFNDLISLIINKPQGAVQQASLPSKCPVRRLKSGLGALVCAVVRKAFG